MFLFGLCDFHLKRFDFVYKFDFLPFNEFDFLTSVIGFIFRLNNELFQELNLFRKLFFVVESLT